MASAYIIKRWWQRQRLRLCNLSCTKQSLNSHNGQAMLQSHWLEICWSIPEKYMAFWDTGVKRCLKSCKTLDFTVNPLSTHTDSLTSQGDLWCGVCLWVNRCDFYTRSSYTPSDSLLNSGWSTCPGSFSRPLQKHTMVLSWYFAIAYIIHAMVINC